MSGRSKARLKRYAAYWFCLIGAIFYPPLFFIFIIQMFFELTTNYGDPDAKIELKNVLPSQRKYYTDNPDPKAKIYIGDPRPTIRHYR